MISSVFLHEDETVSIGIINQRKSKRNKLETPKKERIDNPKGLCEVACGNLTFFSL